LAEFELTDEERAVVVSFETESVRDLVSTVHGWLKEQDGAISPRVGCGVA
jgi:hypothetical protein